MTNAERKILEIIKENPLISQQEIANILNIKRSSVAVQILNLKEKGKILGKGYILKDNDYVSIIGGANVDFIGYSKNEIIKNDSNIGYIKTTLGGVGRNIAENLARLEIKTFLITPIANDNNGKLIIDSSKNQNIDVTNMIIVDDENIRTSSYMAILNDEKDMLYAISDMDIMKFLNPKELNKRKRIIENSKFVIIDANVYEESIKYLFENFPNQKFIVDTVSTKKAIKFLNYLNKIFIIKPNIYELEVLSNVKIKNDKDIKKAANVLINKGLKHLIVSNSKDGIYYYSNENIDGVHFIAKNINVVNATGAGDSFVAGLCYALMNDYSIKEAIEFGMSASYITLKDEKTVSENMNIINLLNENSGGILC